MVITLIINNISVLLTYTHRIIIYDENCTKRMKFYVCDDVSYHIICNITNDINK